jgi:hypothetical protein
MRVEPVFEGFPLSVGKKKFSEPLLSDFYHRPGKGNKSQKRVRTQNIQKMNDSLNYSGSENRLATPKVNDYEQI